MVIMWGGIAVILAAAAITRQQNLLGAIPGYWLGVMNSIWLRRDTLRCVDLDLKSALLKMQRSFFIRLGIVTLIIAAVARWKKGWLLELALGIAAGLIISLISFIRREFKVERGDK